jgi:periplasmic copper chaperone A
MKNTSLFGVALLLAGSAQAHVTLEYQVANAGASYKASFKVGHGCGTSATRQIVVEIPPGVGTPRPMPKPGWNIAIEREGERVTRVGWTAKTREDMLPNAHYDEFVLVARMPKEAGTLYWPVRQVCEEGRTDWVEVPRAGQDPHALKSPAAVLEVLPAGTGGHNH